jgi:hypothetical protein
MRGGLTVRLEDPSMAYAKQREFTADRCWVRSRSAIVQGELVRVSLPMKSIRGFASAIWARDVAIECDSVNDCV